MKGLLVKIGDSFIFLLSVNILHTIMRGLCDPRLTLICSPEIFRLCVINVVSLGNNIFIIKMRVPLAILRSTKETLLLTIFFPLKIDSRIMLVVTR